MGITGKDANFYEQGPARPPPITSRKVLRLLRPNANSSCSHSSGQDGSANRSSPPASDARPFCNRHLRPQAAASRKRMGWRGSSAATSLIWMSCDTETLANPSQNTHLVAIGMLLFTFTNVPTSAPASKYVSIVVARREGARKATCVLCWYVFFLLHICRRLFVGPQILSNRILVLHQMPLQISQSSCNGRKCGDTLGLSTLTGKH